MNQILLCTVALDCSASIIHLPKQRGGSSHTHSHTNATLCCDCGQQNEGLAQNITVPVYPPGPLSGEHGTLIPYRDTGLCAQQHQHRGGIRTSKNDFFQLFFLPLLADLSLDTVSSIVKYMFKLLSDQNRKKYSGIHDCFQSVKQGECYKILSHPSF